MFDQFAIKNPLKLVGQVASLGGDYLDNGTLDNSSKVGNKIESVANTLGSKLGLSNVVDPMVEMEQAADDFNNATTKVKKLEAAARI